MIFFFSDKVHYAVISLFAEPEMMFYIRKLLLLDVISN